MGNIRNNFDILILGNGAIGSLSAILLDNEFPELRIGLVGDPARNNSASVAAGAMCNVFAEVEEPYSKNQKLLQELSLQMGVEGTRGWLELFSKYTQLAQAKTAEDTIVFLKENPSDFELKNYNSALSRTREYGLGESLASRHFNEFFSGALIRPQDAFKIKGEFAFDTRLLFNFFDRKIQDSHISIPANSVFEIDTDSNAVITENGVITYSRLVVALGANTSKLLKDLGLPPMVQGVGSAFEISTKNIQDSSLPRNVVLRTVNRGGAQCGLHFLPRISGYYLGAGNYISNIGKSDHRLETLRYLFNAFEKEICGKKVSYLLEGNLVKGHRPRSIDAFPIIGSISNAPNVFVATGTNRAGLTWAPYIVKFIQGWCRDSLIHAPFDHLISPNRKILDFGEEEEAAMYYTESRLGAAIEHERISSFSVELNVERERLRVIAYQLLAEVRSAIQDPGAVPHPDHWAVILDDASLCFDLGIGR